MRVAILLGLLIIFLVAVQFASGQTVDEVIDNYMQARGGKDKLLAIKSIYMEGMREMMGSEVTVKVTKEQNKLSRIEFEMGGSTGFALITDKQGWTYFPLRSTTPSPIGETAIAGLQTELDIAGPLVNYAAKGHKAELIGKDSVEGVQCYKIRLTTVVNKTIYYWIDTHTNLLLQSSQKGSGMFGGGRKSGNDPEAEMITIYSDYKPVEGILFAHTTTIKMTGSNAFGGGGTTFDKIDINQPVDAKLYNPE